MRHIVIIPDSVKSKRISAIELARRLHEAGYHITLIGSGGSYSKIDIFDYYRLDLKLNPKTENAPASHLKFGKLGQLIWKHQNRRALQTEVVESANTEAFHALIDKLAPDLILIDVELHPYILSAISNNLPVALFNVFFNIWKCAGIPPLHSDVLPGKGLTGTPLFIELLWLRFRLWKWAFNTKNFLSSGGMDWLSLHRRYAESLGFQLHQHVDLYQWLIPYLYKELPTLVFSADEMEFDSPQLDGVTYVGPMICHDREKLPFLPETAKPSSRLENVLDKYRTGRSEKRLIYCSFGNYFSGDDTDFLKKLTRSVIDADWDVIIALGNRVNPDKLGKLPDNITCLPFAPQMDILSVADCAVIHGGLATVYECIHYGVPMVIYPFKVNDQLGNAARVKYHCLGQVGSRTKDSAATIRKRIAETMSDRLLHDNIDRLRRSISRYDDGKIAAKTVDAIIKRYQNQG